MHLGLQVVLVEPPAVERFEHLLDLLLQRFDQWRLVLDAHIPRLVQVVPLDRLPLPLPLQQIVEKRGIGVLGLEFLDFQVYRLPQEVYVLTPLDYQANYLLDAH